MGKPPATLRPFDTIKHTPHKRKIVKTWKSGVSTVKPGESRPTETIIQMTIRHSKEWKAFIADIAPCEEHEHFVQWRSDNPGIRILTERVGRYSEKALITFADRAYQHLLTVADDPRVTQYLTQIPGIIQEDAA